MEYLDTELQDKGLWVQVFENIIWNLIQRIPVSQHDLTLYYETNTSDYQDKNNSNKQPKSTIWKHKN